jgi:DNA-binding NtrC family response regulator
VRELHNVLERAAIVVRSARIGMGDLPELANATDEETATASSITEAAAGPSELPLKDRVTAYERALVVDALRRVGGNQSAAARLLQTSRATLQYKMRVLSI